MEKKSKKPLKIVLSVIAALLVIILVAALGLFGKLALTLTSGTDKLADGIYHVDYKENYKLDQLLERGGASTEDELVAYIIEIMLKGLPVHIDYSIPELGCSTFSAATPDADHLFCRNFDNHPTDLIVVNTAPSDGYRSVSVVSLSFLGYNDTKKPDSVLNRIEILATPYFPLDGVNEKGLAVGVLQLMAEPTNQQTEKPDVGTTLAIRMILDKCATVEEALDLLRAYDMHSSAGGCYHLQIADNNGNSVVVAWVENEMIVIEQEKNYNCATNFYLCEVPFEYEKHGEDRYEIICNTLDKSKGVLSEEGAMELLKAVSADGNNVAQSFTQWSSVYNLTKGTLSLYADRDYEKNYDFAA